MSETEDLGKLLKSKVPVIIIQTGEETEAVKLVCGFARVLHTPVYGWSLIKGFSILDNSGEITGTNNLEPAELLYYIYNNRVPGIFILLDFHPYLQNERNLRLLKETALKAEQYNQTFILISARVEVPHEIKHLSAEFEIPYPSEEIIRKTLSDLVNGFINEEGKHLKIDDSLIDVFIKNLRGLSLSEVKRLIHNALRDNSLSREDLPELARAKYKLLNKDEVLYYEHNASSFQMVGGLRNLKAWLEKRRLVFLGEKEFISDDIPKGILLLGIQGSGKSLAAKSVAGSWGVPLLRLDFGTLYNKYYGETERKTRESLKMADIMSPCVLWMDEIEKGISHGNGDGGTSKRILGTLLTWMSERKSSVFIVATANDIQDLPPELMRKGRFDEIFFVDLPDHEIRKEIFTIHLKKRNIDPSIIDLEKAAEMSSGFSGAEIEQVIISGLYSAAGGYMKLTTEILLEEIDKTRPLSILMAENIEKMRAWAMNRTVPAN